MAYITFKGLEEYEFKISKLAKQSKSLCKQAIYPAAGYMTDRIKEAVKALPIEEGKNGLPPFAPPGEKLSGISTKQRDDLVDSLGIAKMEEKEGYIYAKTGWDGYGSVKTKSWPKGIPNILLARSIESGTRFRVKKPFVRQTVNAHRRQTIKIMSQKVDTILEKEFK